MDVIIKLIVWHYVSSTPYKFHSITIYIVYYNFICEYGIIYLFIYLKHFFISLALYILHISLESN